MENLTGGTHQPTLSPDDVFEVLADSHRRAVLLFLRETAEDAVSLETLAARLAGDDAMSERDPDRLAVHLHHATVPKLADVGLVEYDTRSGWVRSRSHPTVERVLEYVTGSDAP